MNLTKNRTPRKREAARYSPSCYEEGLYIQFFLKTKKHSFARIGEHLGVSPQIVFNVVYGKRRSRRIETEIARILGKADWNEVVLEARSEVQKKPVEAIIREIEQNMKAGTKAVEEGIQNNEQALIYSHDWGPAQKAYKEEQARIQEKQERKKKGVLA